MLMNTSAIYCGKVSIDIMRPNSFAAAIINRIAAEVMAPSLRLPIRSFTVSFL